MKLFKYLFLLPGLLYFASCNNDLEVIADWKETTIVYGILNQNDTAQYIRINKAFLGEGNALTMAQVYDSIQYGNQLTVKLDRIKNGTVIESIPLQKDTSIIKLPGAFSYPNQVLFKTNNAIYYDSEYELTIANNSTGKIIKSKTKLVADFSISKPTLSQHIINLYPDVKVSWITSVYGRLYDATVRFNYIEEDNTTHIQTPKSLDMYLGSLKTQNLAGGETMQIVMKPEDFFSLLKNSFVADANIKRLLRSDHYDIDIVISVAADEFNTYIEINMPSTGIAQEKPEYTNIENGIGIFSARYNKSKTNMSLVGDCIDSLYAKSNTYGWGFVP